MRIVRIYGHYHEAIRSGTQAIQECSVIVKVGFGQRRVAVKIWVWKVELLAYVRMELVKSLREMNISIELL